MLRQQNLKIAPPKKRKLYTPLSDEDESFNIQTCVEKSTENENKIAVNGNVNNIINSFMCFFYSCLIRKYSEGTGFR